MKRAAPEEASGGPKSTSRQTPVSCKHCRTKKLKCDRTHPCFNCHTRKLNCEYEAPLPQKSADPPAASEHLDLILTRLERLERLLQPTLTYQQGDGELRYSSHLRDNGHAEPNVPQPFRYKRQLSTDDEDIQRLDEMPDNIMHAYNNANAMVSRNDIAKPSTASMRDILKLSTPASRTALDVALPPTPDAESLLQIYLKDIEPVQRLLYIPYAPGRMEILYKQATSRQPIDPALLALHLGVFSLAMSRVAMMRPGPFALNYDESMRIAMYWRMKAAEVLQKLKLAVGVSLEQLQATLILAHPGSSIQGVSTGWTFLINEGVVLAKEMRIHQLDSPHYKRMRHKLSVEQLVEQELKRRCWWHLVATDWLMSSISGPFEGTYMIHPHHFQVDEVLNCDDEDLPFMLASSDSPPPRTLPTMTTYLFRRQRMADISRQMSDLRDVDDPALMSITAQWLALLEELPVFYKLDEQSQRMSAPLYASRPYLAIQARVIHCGAHFRVIQLHRSRILRKNVFDGQAYVDSRRICLSSARACVQAASGVPGAWTIGAFVHHVFSAAVVLAVDLQAHSKNTEIQNMNEDPPPASREELQSICDILIKMQAESTIVERLLEPLLDILQKHSNRPSKNSKSVFPGASSHRDRHDFNNQMQTGVDDAILQFADFSVPVLDDSSWDFLFQDLNDSLVPF